MAENSARKMINQVNVENQFFFFLYKVNKLFTLYNK